MKNLTVIIPSFNEEKAVSDTIIKLKPFSEKHSWKIIVVNDGSEDATKTILEKFGFIKTMCHKINRGYGASLKTGS